MIGRNIFLIFIIMLATNVVYANEDSIVASISSSEIGVGERFVLTVALYNINGKVDPPEIENSKYLHETQRKSISYVNGKRTSSTEYFYTYLAEEIGDCIINPIEVKSGRQTYSTKLINFSIVESSNTSSGRTSSSRRSRSRSYFNFSNNDIEDIDKEIFIKSQLSKTNVYMYEPLYFEQNIYISDFVQAEVAAFEKAGEKNDFLVRRDENKYGARTETIDGIRYSKHTLSREVLLAIFSGERSINENLYLFNVASKNIGFNEQIRLGGESFTVNVMPLPENGKPSDFSGGVGEFDFNISIDKNEVAQNESFILKVVASGIGYADTIDLPNIESQLKAKYGSTLEIYQPKHISTNEVKNGKIHGEKVAEYMIVVKDESNAYLGNIELEPVAFSFFSPQKEKYIVLESQKIVLPVLGGSNTEINDSDENSNKNISQTRATTTQEQTRTSDNRNDILLPIKDGIIKIENPSIIYKPSFMYIYLSVSILLLALIFLVKKFIIPLSKNKKKKSSSISFDNAARYLHSGDIKGYIKEIEKIFYENIAAKSKEKVSNSIEMAQVLQAHNVDFDTQEKAKSLIETCHYILYSPSGNIDKNFIEGKRQAEEILNQMKSVISKVY